MKNWSVDDWIRIMFAGCAVVFVIIIVCGIVFSGSTTVTPEQMQIRMAVVSIVSYMIGSAMGSKKSKSE